MIDYSHHYAILSVTHDVDWKTLRARYRRLIGQWHPDRFPGDASRRELAEEHSKQITIAYQALERYYRDHGVLPPMEPATFPKESATQENGTFQTVSPAAGAAPDEAAQPKPTARIPGRHRHTLVVFSLLIAGAFAAYRSSDDEGSETETTAASPRTREIAAPEAREKEAQRESGGISAGSTLGEVYAIQGIPSLAESDTWHYGKSSIRFAQGKVVSWTQHPDNPLRIARDQPIELREGVFDVGSTKDEVRSIQGTPVTESETVWDYGPSRVYFENSRVVRWDANPLQPLRVPR